MSYSTFVEDRLIAVRAAINNILTGSQEYAIGDLRKRAAELETLRKMERDLIAEAEAASGAVFLPVQVDRPT